MHSGRNKAVSFVTIVLILFVSIALIAGLSYVLEQRTVTCACPNVESVTMVGITFNTTTETLNFTLHNPVNTETSISSVDVNQTSCNGNFAMIKAIDIATESCVVYQGLFAKGDTLNYIVTFADSQSIQGFLIAQ